MEDTTEETKTGLVRLFIERKDGSPLTPQASLSEGGTRDQGVTIVGGEHDSRAVNARYRQGNWHAREWEIYN